MCYRKAHIDTIEHERDCVGLLCGADVMTLKLSRIYHKGKEMSRHFIHVLCAITRLCPLIVPGVVGGKTGPD